MIGTLLAAWVSAVLAAASVAVPAGTGAEARALLPDLDPLAPSALAVGAVGGEGVARRFRLSFVSAAGNVGAGPLIVRGRRTSLEEPHMTAEQVVQLDGGGTVDVADVGTFQYVADETHGHWHLLRFMTYELRRAQGFKLVAPDQKTGFCLGDRYDIDPAAALPGEPPERVYTSNCGPLETGLLEVEEGISVGWGDVYEAWRDAQYLDVTGLPAGRYVLVHRVNQGRPLRESVYSNNASSVLISLAWPRGTAHKPKVRPLRVCPDSARCPAP